MQFNMFGKLCFYKSKIGSKIDDYGNKIEIYGETIKFDKVNYQLDNSNSSNNNYGESSSKEYIAVFPISEFGKIKMFDLFYLLDEPYYTEEELTEIATNDNELGLKANYKVASAIPQNLVLVVKLKSTNIGG